VSICPNHAFLAPIWAISLDPVTNGMKKLPTSALASVGSDDIYELMETLNN